MLKGICPGVLSRLLNRRTNSTKEKSMGNALFEVYIFLRRLVYFPIHLYKFRKMPRFRVGDIYLDCAYHPVVATGVERFSYHALGPYDWILSGVSLYDGSSPRSCSVFHCTPRKLDFFLACMALACKRHLPFERLDEVAAELHRRYEKESWLHELWKE